MGTTGLKFGIWYESIKLGKITDYDEVGSEEFKEFRQQI